MTLAQLREPSEKLKKAGLYLVIFLCVFIPFRSPVADLTTGAVKLLSDVLVIGLLGWYAIEIRFRFKFKVQDILFISYVVVGMLSTYLLNHVPLSIMVMQVRSISVYYVLYFVLRNFNYGKKELITIIKVLQVVSYVLFAFAIVEKVTSKSLLFSQEVAMGIIYPSNFARVYSLFYNPNTYGMFLAITFFASAYKSFFLGEKNNIAFYITTLSAIFMSMSRSTLIIMVVGIVIFGAMVLFSKSAKKSWKRVLIRTAVSVVAVAIVTNALSFATGLYYDSFIDDNSDMNEQLSSVAKDSMGLSTADRLNEMRDEEMYESSAANGRLYSINTGLKILKEYPIFGTGFGTFGSGASLNWSNGVGPETYVKYEIPFPFYSDNEYIKVLVENGIVGALLFIAFLIFILKASLRNSLKLFLCILMAWYGLFYNVMEVQIGTMLFWSFLAFSDSAFEGDNGLFSIFKKRSGKKGLPAEVKDGNT